MLLLLSPSKGQDFSPTALAALGTQPDMLTESRLLIDALRKLDVADIQQLMTVSEKIAALNAQRFADWQAPFSPDNAKPAMLAFQGDVYQGLDAASMSDGDLAFAQAHLRMLSGLYGYLRALDLIQPYRLEMKTRLANPRGENLYQFWNGRITDAINSDLARQKNPVVINLASSEYFKAVQPTRLSGRLLQIEFKELKDGKARVIGLFAKRARGMMAGYAVRKHIEDADELKDFDQAGYKFSVRDSDESRWVFQRPQP